jgi:hypothetical protein
MLPTRCQACDLLGLQPHALQLQRATQNGAQWTEKMSNVSQVGAQCGGRQASDGHNTTTIFAICADLKKNQ